MWSRAGSPRFQLVMFLQKHFRDCRLSALTSGRSSNFLLAVLRQRTSYLNIFYPAAFTYHSLMDQLSTAIGSQTDLTSVRCTCNCTSCLHLASSASSAPAPSWRRTDPAFVTAWLAEIPHQAFHRHTESLQHPPGNTNAKMFCQNVCKTHLKSSERIKTYQNGSKLYDLAEFYGSQSRFRSLGITKGPTLTWSWPSHLPHCNLNVEASRHVSVWHLGNWSFPMANTSLAAGKIHHLRLLWVTCDSQSSSHVTHTIGVLGSLLMSGRGGVGWTTMSHKRQKIGLS